MVDESVVNVCVVNTGSWRLCVWHVCCMGDNAGHTCMLHAILMDTHIPVAIS